MPKIENSANIDTSFIPKISKEDLQILANKWVEELMEIDQSIRTEEIRTEINQIHLEFKNLGLNISMKEFATQKIDQNEPNYQTKLDLQNRIKKFNNLFNNLFTQNSEKTRISLENFMIKIGGFPDMDFGIKVIHTAWIIAQHSGDVEFQKQILETMLVAQKNSKIKIPLVYFYYLTDRILSNKGHQFFGTQKGCPIAALPTSFVENITDEKCSNPYYFVVELTKRELPSEIIQTSPNNQDLLKLWELANKNKTVGGQQGMISSFLEKYKI